MSDPVSKLGKLSMWKIIEGNCLDSLRQLPSGSIQACVTSPPFLGLRDYQFGDDYVWPDGWVGQLGLEPSAELFVEHLVIIFREVRRLLADDGVLWLNIGDSYVTEHPQKVREHNTGVHASIPGSRARDA
ncbi:MAG TPA: DNA methyltransferase, partial [Thermoleophilia bacterium]|nr:DNA methyltransferase [Thermoleophilia bacterium]